MEPWFSKIGVGGGNWGVQLGRVCEGHFVLSWLTGAHSDHTAQINLLLCFLFLHLVVAVFLLILFPLPFSLISILSFIFFFSCLYP